MVNGIKKKIIQVCKNTRVRKWWQNDHFWCTINLMQLLICAVSRRVWKLWKNLLLLYSCVIVYYLVFSVIHSKNCSIGMVLPLWSDTKIHLDGDGWVLPPLDTERNSGCWTLRDIWCTDLNYVYEPHFVYYKQNLKHRQGQKKEVSLTNWYLHRL